MIEFILERYNYWIVIVLMMTGLYIVYARGNLVKKIVGLNVFQTSVFIFYITIGKIAGGTAPIYIGGELNHGDGHGDAGHGKPGNAGDHGGGDAHESAASGADHDTAAHTDAAVATPETDSLHSKIDNQFPDAAANDLKDALKNIAPRKGEGASLHDAPEAALETAKKVGNKAFEGIDKSALTGGVEVPEPPHGEAGANEAEIALSHGEEAGDALAHGAADGIENALDAAAHGAGHAEVIYTNPLPHVLILTAIVVGVAGTAVGLALAVRIREAYGTIEEDELEAMDAVAEYGEASEYATEATS